jgi:hypothetical protein
MTRKSPGRRCHKQRLEQHVRHDRLLGVQLVGVEQHRRHGQRRQPPVHAAPHHQRVQRARHEHAQDVLGQRRVGQAAAGQQDRAQDQQRVAERVERAPDRVGEVGAEDVLLRVDEQQGGFVGDLGDASQHQPARQQQPEHPVPADEVHGSPHDPVRAGLRLTCSGQCGVPPVGHPESSPWITSGRGDTPRQSPAAFLADLILPYQEMTDGPMGKFRPVSSPFATRS